MTLLKRFNLWLLKRSVAKLPRPDDDRDTIRSWWDYDQYGLIDDAAVAMEKRIHKKN